MISLSPQVLGALFCFGTVHGRTVVVTTASVQFRFTLLTFC